MHLSLSKYTNSEKLKGLGIAVKHDLYGILFATLIDGSGSLLTNQDEQGVDIPFLTTDQILEQLMRFGFYITYDVKTNLPRHVLNYLSTLLSLGFDKITKVTLEKIDLDGTVIARPVTIVMKSELNTDLLVFGCRINQRKFNSKLENNIIMNVTNEPRMSWDWVTYMAGIQDIIDENTPPEPEPEPEPEPYDDSEEDGDGE